jgi:tRNA dimethylallyltransferase
MVDSLEKIPLLAVMGPTASGKTKLAVALARRYGGEVVSADSMQIYRGMDIGTAKPDAGEMQGVPHHLLDVADPGERFSVADYVRLAAASIREIRARGRLPIVAGGTGLYIASLLDNLTFDETGEDPALRARLRAEAREKGGQALLDRLAAFDPACAAKLHPNNLNRIIRAIEVYETSGVTMTRLQADSRRSPSPYDPCVLGLFYSDRSALYERIDRRVDAMLADGLADEVRRLQAAFGPTAMQAIGYKEIAAALRGETSMEEAAELVRRGTRHYAKRQMTWFKRDERVRWIDCWDVSGGRVRPFGDIFRDACAIVDKWCGV